MGLARTAGLTLGTVLSANRRQLRIERFRSDFHDTIARITACSRAVEDLAESFPALLFALATGYGSQTARSQAFRVIEEGHSLKAAAASLGLPWWTRKLPAAALTAPFEQVPTGSQFDRQIVHLIPKSESAAGPWFRRVLHAAECCGPDFALWAARHQAGVGPEPESERFRYLTAWAWHSQRQDVDAARPIRRPWRPDIGAHTALQEVGVWRCRLDMAASLAVSPGAGWITTRGLRGYQFVPLQSIDDFLAESSAMSNCLDRYAEGMESGRTLIVSMRRETGPIANLELSFDPTGRSRPAISQLKRAGNRAAGPHLWKAAQEWLALQTGPLPQPSRRDRRGDVRKALMQLWAPYLDWLPPRHASALECHLRQATSLRGKPRQR